MSKSIASVFRGTRTTTPRAGFRKVGPMTSLGSTGTVKGGLPPTAKSYANKPSISGPWRPSTGSSRTAPASRSTTVTTKSARALMLDGKSGNVAGRPKRQDALIAKVRTALSNTVLSTEKLTELMRVVYRMAVGTPQTVDADGNVTPGTPPDAAFARLVLDRCIPALKAQSRLVSFDLPKGSLTEQAKALLEAASQGLLPIDQASELIASIARVVSVEQADTLTKRLDALEHEAAAERFSDLA
jgi:hypothetical protein